MKQNFDNGSLIPKASLVTNAREEEIGSVNFLENNKKRLIKIAAVIIGVIAVAVFVIVAYKSLKYSKLPESIEAVPLIKADLAPVKVSPKDPGGEQISNQDKLIYSTLENKNVKAKKLSEKNEVKELKEVYSDAKTIRAPATETKPKTKVEVSEKKDIKNSKSSDATSKKQTMQKPLVHNKSKVENASPTTKKKEDKTVKTKDSESADKKEKTEAQKESKVDVIALEKEIDSKPIVKLKTEAKQNASSLSEKNSKTENKAKISNPFDLVGEND